MKTPRTSITLICFGAVILVELVMLLALLWTAKDSGTPPETTAPPGVETTVAPPTETVPVLEDPSWLPAPRKTLSYEAYFAYPREFDCYSSNPGMDWAVGEDGSVRYQTALMKKDKKTKSGLYSGYKLIPDPQGLFIAAYENMPASDYFKLELSNANIVWKVPGSEIMTGCEEYITDGEWVYCIHDQKRVLRISLLTGEITVLFEGESVPTDRKCDLDLHGRDMLFFMAREGEYASIYRMYLPTMTLDLIYDQVLAEDLTSDFNIHVSGNTMVTWRVLTPEFKEALFAPDSPYKEVLSTEGQAMWDAGDLSRVMEDSFIWFAAEDFERDTKIPSMLYYSYDCSTGKCSSQELFYDRELNMSELGIYVDMWD